MTILEEAAALIDGDRDVAYGNARRNWEEIAAMWSVILRHPVTARHAILCMIALKVSREAHSSKRDNAVDIAGYAGLLERL